MALFALVSTHTN